MRATKTVKRQTTWRNVKKKKTLTSKIAQRIAKRQRKVFLREDFSDLAGYDQVGRGLRMLVKQGKLVKIGYGLYAKATTSPLSGKPVPAAGIREIAQQALERLDVPVVPSSYDRDYKEERTTQIPTGRVIGIKGRTRRKIGYDGKYVTFEYA